MTIAPNFLDRAWLAVAPAYGLRRLHARIAAAEITRAYEGAGRDRRLGNWLTTGAGPNTENEAALTTLRSRARDLARNNKPAAAAKLQFQGQTVGTGISPRAIDGRKTLRQKANDAWARFVDTCDPEGQQDYHGIMSTTAGALFVDGEALHLWLDDPETGVPYSQIRILEGDHLDESRMLPASTQIDRIVSGIEFDKWSRRRRYWLHPNHPGEYDLRGSWQSEPVDAANIDHFYHVARPGQVRGISWLAPSIVALRGLDDVTEAVIWRKRVEACIGLVLRTPETQGSVPVVGTQKTDARGRVEETLAPGKILRTGPGEDVTAFQPSSSGDAIEFVRSQLYAFVATTGIPYHAITGDASQANYSSMRAAQLAGNVLIDMVQWLVLAPRIRAAWRRVMKREAILTGDDRFISIRCELAMPVRAWVDPLKDITGKIAEIRAGLQSMPDALAERGVNWEQQLGEIETFLKAIDAAGIVLDTDPRKINHSGATQKMLTGDATDIADAAPQSPN